MATHETIKSKADTPPASDLQAAKTEMGQKKALVVYQRLSSCDNGRSRHVDDFKPMGDEWAIVVAQQSMHVDDYLPPPPLCIPWRMGKKIAQAFIMKKEQGKLEQRKRKRGRPSAKSNIEQKPESFDSSSSSSSCSKGVKDDDDFEPPTPTRKRGRPARSKSAKSKMEPLLVDSSSSSESKKDKDYNFVPEVSDDDGWKKHTCVKGTAWERAEEVRKKLTDEICFVRCMLHSHVVKGFWLGLPGVFCRNNLPEQDVHIVLEDEEGQTCETNYLADRTALSGGWKRFAEQHDLKVGDALVFQLVQPTRFKVYILRENKFTTTDGALGLLSLDPSTENKSSKKEEKESSGKAIKSKTVPRKKKKKVPTRVRSNPSSNNSDNLAGEEAAGGGIGSPGPDTGVFVAVKSLKDFKIVVGDNNFFGCVVLPDRLRNRYYELCHARNAFLHTSQICPTLATEMIVETANIAEGIMACTADSLEDLVGWKKTLESFEAKGMDVAFMGKRVDGLIALLSTPSLRTMEEPEGYAELKLERARVAERLRALESRLSAYKDAVKEMDVEMEMMEANEKKEKDPAVRRLATAPW